MDGFLYEWSRADVNAEGGFRKKRVLVVAQDISAAHATVVATVGTAITLVAHGPPVLNEAKSLNMADGEVRILD